MRIVEVLDVVNAEKTLLGPKVMKLEFDTETGRLAIDAPAMFTDPVVRMDQLQEVLDKFKSIDRSGAG